MCALKLCFESWKRELYYEFSSLTLHICYYALYTRECIYMNMLIVLHIPLCYAQKTKRKFSGSWHWKRGWLAGFRQMKRTKKKHNKKQHINEKKKKNERTDIFPPLPGQARPGQTRRDWPSKN